MEQASSGSTTSLFLDANLPDLTHTLQQHGRRAIGHGSFGTVYHCMDAKLGEVAVKAITLPRGMNKDDKDEFMRKTKREPAIWRRVGHHPNIVTLLGTASGEAFASDHLCMVSVWMPNGTLFEYVKRGDGLPPLPTRIRLIQGSAAGLEYLHSEPRPIVHGDFHPGNIMIDSDYNPRITDFGYSRTLTHVEQFTYLWTNSSRGGLAVYVAPELLRPDLYENLIPEVTLRSDICSLGSIIHYILSGASPWKDRTAYEGQLENSKTLLRPVWPVIPDGVWDLIERCWSLRDPIKRPSAQEVLSFSKDRLEQQLQPNPASNINVVLFGALGCGKSSIINLLAGEPVAPVSTNMEPCTKRPRCYRTLIGNRRFRLWDTTGFRVPRGGAISPLLPYKQAYNVLRNLPDGGVHLILLCARKDGINSSLRGLYWLINRFFFGRCAPVAFIVTHPDTLDELEWWKQNERTITKKTGIPVQEFIPRACITISPAYHDQSRQRLRSLLEKHAAFATPIPLRLDLSSYTEASHDIASNCEMSDSDATALVEKFGRQRNALNAILFGKVGVGKSSVVNLVAQRRAARVSSGIDSCTVVSTPYEIDATTHQFLLWDIMGFSGVCDGRDMTRQAVLNAVHLIRDLLAEGRVDLLVFVKGSGKLTPSELNHYRLMEEFLCEGQVPVAVIVTQLESYEVMGQWWEANGQGLLDALHGNIIGHACITSLVNNDPEGAKLNKKLSESRMSVQDLFNGCFTSPKPEGGRVDHVPEAMTTENLQKRCGLSEELAKEVIGLYNGSG